jgi:hypothetical protein
MSVRVTDEEHVALYDSTSGEAFGSVFENQHEAEHFLSWHEKKAEREELFMYGSHKVQYASDVRVYSRPMLTTVVTYWRMEYHGDG